MGEPRSFVVEKDASYVLEIPGLYSSLESRLGLQVTERLLEKVKADGLSVFLAKSQGAKEIGCLRVLPSRAREARFWPR